MRTLLRAVALGLPLLLSACPARVASVSPAEAAAKVQRGQAILVDVREADELDEGLAAPARWYATSAIARDPQAFAQFLRQNATGREVIFYCAAGGRAGQAAEQARALGFEAANMGGFASWVQAGLPVTRR